MVVETATRIIQVEMPAELAEALAKQTSLDKPIKVEHYTAVVQGHVDYGG